MDNCLSPRLSRLLSAAGEDALHVRDYGMASASDEQILERARLELRTVISADMDFSDMLALTAAHGPSVILFRGGETTRPSEQARMILEELRRLRPHLAAGAIAVFYRGFVRVRRLPVR